MCGSFKASITKLFFSQVSEFSLHKNLFTLITGKAGVMPELPPDGESNSSDGLNYFIDSTKGGTDIITTDLHAGMALVKHGARIARLAEELVLEDDIVQRYSCSAFRTL